MKLLRRIIVVLLVILGILLVGRTVEGTPQKNIRILDARKVPSEKIWKTIESRNGDLIILETHGKPYDSKGNGKDELGYTKYHGVPKGTRVTSYFVFNPSSNYWDDIILRCDYVRGELIYVR